jgi:hypothetical protein
VATVTIDREVDRFVLYFDTPRHEVNAYALATSLIGLADAIREANAAVNPGHAVEVVVEALPDGSFQAVVRTIYLQAKDLFQHEAVKAIVYGIIATHLYEVAIKKDSDTKVIVNDGSVAITNGDETIIVPRDVYDATRRLEKSDRFRTAVDQIVKGAESDPEVRGIGLKMDGEKGAPPIYVPRDRFAIFSNREITPDGSREVIEFANLEISRAILERGRRRWEFYWRGVRIAAPVLDDRFFDRFFAHEVTIAPGDSLRVMLRIVQSPKKDTGIYVNSAYEVVEVLEHIPRARQASL